MTRPIPNLYDSNIVLGEGPVPCNFLLIGEAPGYHENLHKRPFIGRAGAGELDPALAIAGRPRHTVRITNCVKQRPPSNRTPTWSEIQKHRPFLLEEIRECKPKVILAMGKTAFRTLVNEEKVGPLYEIRKKIFFLGKARVFPTYHPAAVLRSADLRIPFREDIERSIEWLRKSI